MEIGAWFAQRVPAAWFTTPAAIRSGMDAIEVVGELPAVELPAGADDAVRAAAAAGRIARFREDTRAERMAIAEAAQAEFGLPVTWGATCGEASLLFTPGADAAGAGPAWGRRGDFVRV